MKSAAIEPLLTFAEAAKALHVSLRQIRRLVDCGKIAIIRVSDRAPRIQGSELRRYLELVTIRFSAS